MHYKAFYPRRVGKTIKTEQDRPLCCEVSERTPQRLWFDVSVIFTNGWLILFLNHMWQNLLMCGFVLQFHTRPWQFRLF